MKNNISLAVSVLACIFAVVLPIVLASTASTPAPLTEFVGDAVEDGEYGANPYYKVPVDNASVFASAVKGSSFDEGYGAQCVAGFKEWTYSLKGAIVATGTGGASGYALNRNTMVELEKIGLEWHSDVNTIQAGDWAVFDVGVYGHIAMYMSPGVYLGQNQLGGDIYKGSPFSISTLPFANTAVGYWRDDAFTNASKPPVPAPAIPSAPAPVPNVYNVHTGETAYLPEKDWVHCGSKCEWKPINP